MKNYRILLSALVALLMIAAVACESDGRRFDPTRILDPGVASDSDDQFLNGDPDGDGDGFMKTDGDDDDDDDSNSCGSDGDSPDEYDDEMIPDPSQGDDDDDDDC